MTAHKEGHIPYQLPRYSDEEMQGRLDAMYVHLSGRRSVRTFSSDPVPMEVLHQAVRIAGTAPSGAHKQPWTFCIVTDPDLRKRIRVAVEEEELRSYSERMSERWLEDLAPLATDHIKPFIEEAPALIIVFRRIHETDADTGQRHPNYYVQESCGIAVGLLLAALHEAGLAALTHTPSPMNFLGELLQRPDNERAFLNIPVGWPANDTTVPNLSRKTLDEICVNYPPEDKNSHK
ncbi:MAG: nitroreductase family protein [Flavobacteriales bacterium]|nr:nitroreductase family protein [Flavobacteriales bacterium]